MVEEIQECDMSTSETTFDNLIILREFGNIVNLVRDEDFLEIVPKAKIKRLKWVPMFNCLKQGIFNEMVQELSVMWEYEKMPEKIDLLEKQKEKFADINSSTTLWRPQLGDVKTQLKANDVANLKKQKALLESMAKEYDTRVNRLKKILSAKRGYLKALNMDIQKYIKRNDDIIISVTEKLEHHENKINTKEIRLFKIDEQCWSEINNINE